MSEVMSEFSVGEKSSGSLVFFFGQKGWGDAEELSNNTTDIPALKGAARYVLLTPLLQKRISHVLFVFHGNASRDHFIIST